VAGLGRFRALVATEQGVPPAFAEVGEESLGEGEVTVEVAYSSLNYKDALATTATAPVVRRFPLTIGIDLAGSVVASSDPGFSVGDEVLVAGGGLGEDHPGAYARYARVPAEWCVRLPEGLGAVGAMALGTAGLTAMLCCAALERNGATPERLGGEPVLVTGAAGGVGSYAVALLGRLGYTVVASTGRVEEAAYLSALGAARVVGREELAPVGRGPLGPVSFASAIDVVGGATLAEVLRRAAPNGTVAACGLAGGSQLESTVYPFILRGVVLAGVNSVTLHAEERRATWSRLGALLPDGLAGTVARVEALSEVASLAPEVLAGRVRGRVVLDVAR